MLFTPNAELSRLTKRGDFAVECAAPQRRGALCGRLERIVMATVSLSKHFRFDADLQNYTFILNISDISRTTRSPASAGGRLIRLIITWPDLLLPPISIGARLFEPDYF